MRNLLNKLKGKKLNKKLTSIMLSVLLAFTFVTGYFISISNASTISISDLQIGDTVTLGRVGNLDLVWRVVGFESNGEILSTGTNPYVVLENWQDLTYYKGLQFDFPHTGDEYSYFNTFGSNEWQDSALRKLLNSTADAANVNYTDTYYQGSGYNLNGFLHDFTSEEIDFIKDTTHIHAVNGNSKNKIGREAMPYDEYSNQDYRTISRAQFIGYNNLLNNYYHKESTEKIFLMSYYELGQAISKGYNGGFVWSDGTTDGKHYYLLRDSSTRFLMDYTHGVRWVHYSKITAHNGDIYGNNVANHYIEELDSNVSDENTYIRPACVLDGTKTLSVRSEGDYYVPKPSLEDATIEGIEEELLFDGTDKKQTGYTVQYNGVTLTEGTAGNADSNASSLKLGDIVTIGKLGNHPLKWRVIGFDEDCNQTGTSPYLILDNWQDSELSSYKGFKFDPAHNSSDPVSAHQNFGSPNWADSTLRMWYNSADAAGDWYAHDYYSGTDPYGKDGFLHEFEDYEVDAIKPVTHKFVVCADEKVDGQGTAVHIHKNSAFISTSDDQPLQNYSTAYYQLCEDKIFAPNILELTNAYLSRGLSSFNYPGNNEVYWLRDENIESSITVRRVGMMQGMISNANAANSEDYLTLRPALILKESAGLKTIEAGKYEVAEIQSGDYSVSYTGNLQGPGVVTMTFTGVGSYEGTKTFTYSIVKKSMEDVTITGLSDKVLYDGTEKKQTSYVLTYKDNSVLAEKIITGDKKASNLELGDIVTLGKLKGHDLKWRVVGFGVNAEASKESGNPYLVLDNFDSSDFSDYIGMSYDKKHSGDSNSSRNSNGSGYWETSTIRTWLNSDLPDGSIDYNHEYYAGNQNAYSGFNGFLYEFTDYEKKSLMEVTHKSIVSSSDPQDGGSANHTYAYNGTLTNCLQNYDTAYYKNSTDKVFLMNMKELNNIDVSKTSSGFTLYKNTNYYLRDILATSNYSVRYVNGNLQVGNIYATGSSNSYIRPAIMLNGDAALITLGQGADANYSIGSETERDFVVSYTGDLTRPGEVTMTFTGTGSYDGTITKKYNIVKKSMNDVTVAQLQDFVFDGNSHLQPSFTLTYKDNTPLEEKIIVGDKTASELNLGDTIFLGKVGGYDLKWRVVGFGSDAEADKSKGAPYLVLDNYLDANIKSNISVVFDPSHTNDPTTNRNTNGSSTWHTSTIRTWLNSDLPNGSINYNHDYYTGNQNANSGKNGFLYEFTDYEKNALLNVTHKSFVYLDTESDGGTKRNKPQYSLDSTSQTYCLHDYNDAYYKNSSDKVFLIGIKEYANIYNSKGSSNFQNFGSSESYFLRDACTNSNQEYFVYSINSSYNADLKNLNVKNTYPTRPAIMLDENAALISEEAGSDALYKLGTIVEKDYTVSYSNDTTNVGTVTVTFTGTGNYDGTITKTYKILSNEIDTERISVSINDESVTYTGSAIELDKDLFTVKIDNETVVSSDNFTITGYSEDHTNAGLKTVTLKLSGIFDSEEVTENFTIHPASILGEDVLTMPNIQQNLIYTGSALTPNGLDVVWNSSETLTDEVDYDLTISNNINAGLGDITVVAKGNFSGTKVFKFPIATKNISGADITSDLGNKTYTGSSIEPGDFTVTDTARSANLNSSDFEITSYGENKEIGTDSGSVIITGKGNYTGTHEFKFNIVGVNVSDLSDITVNVSGTYTYTGSAIEPAANVSVSLDGTLLDASDWEITGYENNTNASTDTSKAKVKVHLINHYSSDETYGEFTINTVDISSNSNITMPNVNADNFKYTGSSLSPQDMTVKWNSNTLEEDTDYAITLSDNVDAGTAKVTVTGIGNFSGSKVFNFTISKRNIEEDSIEYFVPDEEYQNGTQIKPTSFTVKDASINNRELTLGVDYSIDQSGYGPNNAKGDNAGSITIVGGGNFEGTKVLYFNIVGAKINDLSRITATLDDSGLIYTGLPQTPSDKITVKLDGTPLDETSWEVVSASWTNNTNAGSASVKVKLKGNYSSDPVTINFTIKQKELDSTDFTFSGSGVATKEVTLKSEYSELVPASEYSKLLVEYNDVVLNFTSAKFKGISASDNPMKFGACIVTLSGLSVSDSNYKLKDSFTSFDVDSTHGLLVDKIKPELLSTFVTIPNGKYKTGEFIYIELNFDKDISMNGTNPKLEFYSNVLSDGKIGTLDANKYKAQALYDLISGNKVKFKYEVKEGDYLPCGFTFALSDIINCDSLTDANGNVVNYESKSQRFDNVIVLSKTGVFDEIKNLVEGNDTNKENKILNILKDDDKTDLIFDSDADLKSKIGSGAPDDALREAVSSYLAKGEDFDLSDIPKLIDEIKKALQAKELEEEIKARLDDTLNPPTKEEIDDMMIDYQRLSSNEKKIFSEDVKSKLETLYYANLTDDYKYKDNPQGEANEIEMYGIATRTSAASQGKAVKLKVERIVDNAKINDLQGMITSNQGGVVENPQTERILAPYDITLVDSDDAPVTIPGDKVLCKIELPSGYYGKIINIYHKVDDTTLEMVQNKLIQKTGDKCLVYFDCDAFSPYFMTSDVISVKSSLDPESTEGTVSPLGLFTVTSGENKDFIFTKSGDTNRVDITLSKYNNQTKEFDLVSGIDPINLFNTSKYTLKNITTNMFITFKLSHDDNFKQSSGGGGGGGGGGAAPKPAEPIKPEEPIRPDEEVNYDFIAYMNGYEDGTFGPNLNMTRAEAATIIARISNDFSEDKDYLDSAKGYKDYNPRHWANKYIGYVTQSEIMQGDEKGFRPNDPITRGEFSKLVYKLMNLENANLAIVNTFSDCKGKFYETYSNALYSANILTGYEDGTFKGNNKITRTEAAIMINKATGRGLDKEKTLKALKESEDFKEFKDVPSNRWFYLDDMMATNSYTLEKEIDQTLVDNPEKE